MWGQFWRILETDEVPSDVVGMFYQAVVASTTSRAGSTIHPPLPTLRKLEGIHVEPVHGITGMRPWKVKEE